MEQEILHQVTSVPSKAAAAAPSAAARAGRWLCLGLLALALYVGFGAAEQLAAALKTPSLRWRQPVPWQQASRLYQQAETGRRAAALPLEKSGAEQTVCPTFWQEQPGEAAGPRSTAPAVAVWVLGEPSLAFPARCLAGALPTRYEAEGCAVSEGLALALFGSPDAVGQTVRWQGRTLMVCGVFAGQTARLAANARPGQGFCCAELAGLAAGEPDMDAAARRWAAGCGLAAPDTVVCGPGLAALGHALAFLPLAAAAAQLLAAFWRALRRCPAPAPQLAGWGIVFMAAGGLPLLAARLPGWLRPGRWSDVAFWQAVCGRLAGQGMELLALPPAGRDLLAKQCGLVLLGAVLAGLWLAAPLGAWASGPERPAG